TVPLHLRDKRLPFPPETTPIRRTRITLQQDPRTRFPILEIPARPVLVRHDVPRGNAIPICKLRSQPCSSIQCSGLSRGAAEFADLHTDARDVAEPAVFRMIP